MEAVAAAAQARRQPRIWLNVLKNNPAGERFYRRCGFEVIGDIRFATDRMDIGLHVMRRELAPTELRRFKT
jgi:ribosomal protein S18 acetylase RimI-like enzyme